MLTGSRPRLVGWRAIVAIATVGFVLVVAWQTDPAVAQSESEGEAVYSANCAGCHQADGAGIPGAFPPLANNPNAADAAYVESVIRDGLTGSIDVLGVTYDSAMSPIALDDSEVAAVVAYVQSIAGDATAPTTTGPAVATTGPAVTTTGPPVAAAGDPERGEKLFAGSMGFGNGGPACHACHAAGSLGLRGGNGLGPDLTESSARFGGEAGLSAWLANPASATMQPLFADKQLTEAERADLAAYLGTVQGTAPDDGFDMLLLGGIFGFVILLLFMALIIRGPQETYTARLRRQP